MGRRIRVIRTTIAKRGEARRWLADAVGFRETTISRDEIEPIAPAERDPERVALLVA